MPVYRRLLPSSCWYPFILLGGERQVKSSVLPKDTIHGQQLDSNPGPSDLKLQTLTTAPRTSSGTVQLNNAGMHHVCIFQKWTPKQMEQECNALAHVAPQSWAYILKFQPDKRSSFLTNRLGGQSSSHQCHSAFA